MADWALAIGVSKYLAAPSLSACINDVVEFRKWLISPKEGNVPETNIILSLSPTNPSDVPNGLQYGDARSDDMIIAIDELIRRSGGQGERLFFYYSGHGLSNEENFIEEDAMIGSDCSAQFPDKALSLQSVTNYLATFQFKQQFFFFDACRDIPFPFKYRIRYWPRPQQRDYKLPPVQQFVFLGTSPGRRSCIAPGQPNSVFTQILLQGLKGEGSAKVWDPRGRGRYLVRIDSLLKYVSMKVYEEMKKYGDIQAPEMKRSNTAAYGDSNPILATFPSTGVRTEELVVVNFTPESNESG
jgi:Caspase domain